MKITAFFFAVGLGLCIGNAPIWAANSVQVTDSGASSLRGHLSSTYDPNVKAETFGASGKTPSGKTSASAEVPDFSFSVTDDSSDSTSSNHTVSATASANKAVIDLEAFDDNFKTFFNTFGGNLMVNFFLDNLKVSGSGSTSTVLTVIAYQGTSPTDRHPISLGTSVGTYSTSSGVTSHEAGVLLHLPRVSSGHDTISSKVVPISLKLAKTSASEFDLLFDITLKQTATGSSSKNAHASALIYGSPESDGNSTPPITVNGKDSGLDVVNGGAGFFPTLFPNPSPEPATVLEFSVATAAIGLLAWKRSRFQKAVR